MIIRVGDYVNSKWEEQEDDFKRWERQKGKFYEGVNIIGNAFDIQYIINMISIVINNIYCHTLKGRNRN